MRCRYWQRKRVYTLLTDWYRKQQIVGFYPKPGRIEGKKQAIIQPQHHDSRKGTHLTSRRAPLAPPRRSLHVWDSQAVTPPLSFNSLILHSRRLLTELRSLFNSFVTLVKILVTVCQLRRQHTLAGAYRHCRSSTAAQLLSMASWLPVVTELSCNLEST